MVQLLYEVRRHDRKITEIEHALQHGDLEKLSEITDIAKSNQLRQFQIDNQPLIETQIYEQHKAAYDKFYERCLDVAKYPCISCDKLCYRRECSHLGSLRSLPNSCEWQALMDYNTRRLEYNDGLPEGFICKYCLNNFRQGKLPPRCILNSLQFGDIPQEISQLNAFEKILIQRAKCFQTVSRMGTVAKRQLPASHKIQKVIGTTFHLPLPIEETLNKLPDPQQALPNHGELFILIRSLPSKSNVIWQDLVDINKVYNALLKLKEINPLYALIQLPGAPEDLDIGNRIDEGSYGEPLSTSGEAMVEEIAEHEEQSYYEQYTINPLHAPRENKKATALYQMLKVNEAPLDSRMKNLDMLCFPDLYPHGIGGQRCQREVPLSVAEYVKCILQSRDPRLRINQQLIFFLNNQTILRQIASGIYHKLKVIRPSEKLTAARYLEMLSSEELEGNLTTIFARVRNTESFWTRHRNDLNCMSFHYGPPTWFITLNPGEWLWEDLRTYLKIVNPSFADMSIAEMIATDPVSSSRFIDNKYKAIYDFILSDSQPLGPVCALGANREHQGRGLQHSHAEAWVEGAPIIGESTEEEICEFVTKYVTCHIPDITLSPTLYERVITFQQHKCNNYCLRSKKTNAGVKKNAVAGRKSLKTNSRLYDLPRAANEMRINDYNPAMLLAWQGNMDIQFIGENSSVLNWYCTKYCTKPEKSHALQEFDDINKSTKSITSKLWNFAMKSISHRECGALEACDTLLGIPLFVTDPNTTIRWVDVNMVRSRRLKEKSIIEGLEDQEVEKYYYAILLLFKPWRNSETLIGSSESFQCEFENCREQLLDAVNYHNRLQQMQK
ncbi:uncharacterized protein [Dysidea avara]|uniref:uncharacterized protein n=1 Tax=Dysidea avara TaxID=196820 RepID=UPI00332E2D7F